MTKLFYPIIIIGLSIISISCESNNEEDEFGPCNPSNVLFKTDVQPILNASCTGCHQSGSTVGAGIILTSHSTVKEQIDANKFIESIKWANNVSNMPKGASEQIDACEIETIQTWINEGSKDN